MTSVLSPLDFQLCGVLFCNLIIFAQAHFIAWCNLGYPKMQMKGLIRKLNVHFFWFSHSSSEEHPGASKPPISSSTMTSRILLRQQLMREQMQEQERREQQQKLQAAQFMQQRVPVSQTPAINVSVPTTLPSAPTTTLHFPSL